MLLAFHLEQGFFFLSSNFYSFFTSLSFALISFFFFKFFFN